MLVLAERHGFTGLIVTCGSRAFKRGVGFLRQADYLTDQLGKKQM